MRRKFLLSSLVALWFVGFTWAADEPQETPKQTVRSWSKMLFEPPAHDELKKADEASRKLPFLIGQPIPAQLQELQNVNAMTQSWMSGEYWLGIECYPVTPVLCVHLNLSKNQGLVVNIVVPDSPAAKAGIEATDILLQVGEKKLFGVKDLIEAVETAKETPLKLEIIHAGKPKTIEITPAKRPPNAMFKQEGTPADWKEIEQWMQKMHSGENPDRSKQLRFRFIQPGAILPPGAPVQPSLPGNLSVTINRSDNKPAQITVKWNDKQWEITEEELDKLPAEVRPYVEQMLGRVKVGKAGGDTLNLVPDVTIPAPSPGAPGAQGSQMQVRPFGSLEERLDEVNRKLDQIRKALREQREERHPPAKAEKDTNDIHVDRPAEADAPAK
jgi:membrane-associated protease RseP (regulator of RpoE activity)